MGLKKPTNITDAEFCGGVAVNNLSSVNHENWLITITVSTV